MDLEGEGEWRSVNRDGERSTTDDGSVVYHFHGKSHSLLGLAVSQLSPEVSEKAGISPEIQQRLYEMNDGKEGGIYWNGDPQSFEQIADWIEENL